MLDPLSQESIVELAQELIRIPSVNPTLVPDEGTGETAVAQFACQWLSARGVAAWLDEAAPGRPNAVGEVRGEAGPTLVLCAHLDTVSTTGMTIHAFEPRLHQGRMYGRGSYDMKGAAAAAMSAMGALAREQIPGRVLLALVADAWFSPTPPTAAAVWPDAWWNGP